MTAGFLLAANGHIDWVLYFATLVGLSCIIGSGCVFNNYIDRDIDEKMKRTEKRALVTGTISSQDALRFGTALGLIGAALLGIFANVLTLAVAALGFFFYVVVYSLWGKRQTVHGTVIGSISGAVPPVVGYCAVSNTLDVAAFLLFLILVFWQMPHFYSIALFRSKEYGAAKIPVLPLVSGAAATKKQIIGYVIAFMIAVSALSISGHAGYTLLIAGLLLGFWWLHAGLKGFDTTNTEKWARGMFGQSLLVLTLTSVLIGANAWLP